MIRDLVLGARMAFSGGRDGLLRTTMATLAMGLGVALMLAAASIPALLQERHERISARDEAGFARREPLAKSEATVLVAPFHTEYHGRDIRGRIVEPEGPRAPLPPGVVTWPGPGEMVVSPALGELLSRKDGQLLVQRLGARVVGLIADEGLAGPREYAFYKGGRGLDPDTGKAVRLAEFGDDGTPGTLHPILVLLVVIGFVVLLLPIAVFLGTATRFGGEQRDRRLAALRLVGADHRMLARIAAGEAVPAALLGVATGVVFLLIGRRFVPWVSLWDISVFAADVRPDPLLAAAVFVAVPLMAVGVALTALRGIAVEPLGVVRRSVRVRRKVWWRLLMPIGGLALLWPSLGDVDSGGGSVSQIRVTVGAILLLLGVTALLPWLVEAVVRKLDGGGVSWQLAVRRLQLDAATAARTVSGVAVAVAGAIALQVFLTSVQTQFARTTPEDPSRAEMVANILTGGTGPAPAEVGAKLAATPGVSSVRMLTTVFTHRGDGLPARLMVGDCAMLREVAQVGACADGDVFHIVGAPGTAHGEAKPAPGTQIHLSDDEPAKWTVPEHVPDVPARVDAQGIHHTGLFLTPAATGGRPLGPAPTNAYVNIDESYPDAVEHVRNTAATIDVRMHVAMLARQQVDPQFADIRNALLAGVVVTLLLIGASLLVGTLEQLRERRRLLAVLVAFGTRRRTLGWSLLWQACVPMALGLLLAVAAGTGLGALLLAIVSQPIRFDWAAIGAFVLAGAVVVLLVTVLSLPALHRMMRAEGLRTE